MVRTTAPPYNVRSVDPEQPPAHYPLVCGIDPATDCPDCRAAGAERIRALTGPGDRARETWEDLQGRYWSLLRTGPRAQRPDPLRPDELVRLVGAALDPRHRPLLREILLDLLGDELVGIIVEVAREVCHAA
jgi:hypothetical protein